MKTSRMDYQKLQEVIQEIRSLNFQIHKGEALEYQKKYYQEKKKEVI